MSLKGKTIIVTGAASGIGATTAKLLKKQGATVIGFDLNQPKDGVDEYIQLDLANETSIAEAAAKFKGTADALCNIAGIPPTKPAPLVLKVNFLGLRKFTEAMIPRLNFGASIVNLASVAGSGWPQNLEKIKQLLAITSLGDADKFCEEHEINAEVSYGFSKEVLIVWTMQNFYKWKDHAIRINSVSPGPVNTPILPDFLATLGRAAEDVALIDRPGEPEEIASVVAFLCDPESKWVNGANIAVDGGLFAAVAGKNMDF